MKRKIILVITILIITFISFYGGYSLHPYTDLVVNLRETNSLSQELYRRCMDTNTIQYGNLSSENKIIEINKMKERMNNTWGKLRVVESRLQPNLNQSFLTK